jgi:hypothetical protein
MGRRRFQKWEIESYRTWYADARQLLIDEFGSDNELMAGLLAATSPRQSVKKNWKSALQVYRTFKAGGPINLHGIMKPMHKNVYRALAGEPLSGEKVESFRQNLIGRWDAVTIDVWMIRWEKSDKKSLTKKQYRTLAKRIRRRAKSHNLKPCEYQAIAWSCIRSDNGLGYRSFKSVYDSMNRQMMLWD